MLIFGDISPPFSFLLPKSRANNYNKIFKKYSNLGLLPLYSITKKHKTYSKIFKNYKGIISFPRIQEKNKIGQVVTQKQGKKVKKRQKTKLNYRSMYKTI